MAASAPTREGFCQEQRQLALLDGAGQQTAESPVEIVVSGRELRPTPVFDTYWRFAAARQALYEARLRGAAWPWTNDPILRRHRFTNCYRAADRVSQFLISNVIYSGPQQPEEIAFRTLLFKVFNRISTWQLLESALGEGDLGNLRLRTV